LLRDPKQVRNFSSIRNNKKGTCQQEYNNHAFGELSSEKFKNLKNCYEVQHEYIIANRNNSISEDENNGGSGDKFDLELNE